MYAHPGTTTTKNMEFPKGDEFYPRKKQKLLPVYSGFKTTAPMPT
jgi:hypothetical protein